MSQMKAYNFLNRRKKIYRQIGPNTGDISLNFNLYKQINNTPNQ